MGDRLRLTRVSRFGGSLERDTSPISCSPLAAPPCTSIVATTRANRVRNSRTRRLFNTAVFEAVLVRDGKAADARYREPVDVLFSSRRFEYGDLAGERGFEPLTLHPPD